MEETSDRHSGFNYMKQSVIGQRQGAAESHHCELKKE
jgi:hypothetical protein